MDGFQGQDEDRCQVLPKRREHDTGLRFEGILCDRSQRSSAEIKAAVRIQAAGMRVDADGGGKTPLADLWKRRQRAENSY